MHAWIFAAAVAACSAPQFRQLDYWVGEWDVQINGRKIADSSIQRILNGCVIFENYDAQRGYSGKSFSIYDAAQHRWEQRYVDTTGAFHEWTGGVSNEGMRFLYRHNGTIERMTYIKVGADRVRQLIEASKDGGKTWKVEFDGLYVRKRS